jgi:hypothetical protein
MARIGADPMSRKPSDLHGPEQSKRIIEFVQRISIADRSRVAKPPNPDQGQLRLWAKGAFLRATTASRTLFSTRFRHYNFCFDFTKR